MLVVLWFSLSQWSDGAHDAAPSEEGGGARPVDGRAHRGHVLLRAPRSPRRAAAGAYGAAIVISFKVFARWDDAAQLRWDDYYFEVHELYVRFFLEHRKNAQAQGNFVDVARRQDPRERSAYSIICAARRILRRGFVLPYIDARGRVDSSRCMPYRNHIRHLRSCLVYIGVPPGEAEKFAGQSARAGAATCAARAGVPPHEICRLAGVKSIGWHLGYMRPDFDDRMRASWAVGLELSYVVGAEDHMCWGKATIIRELEAPTPLSRKLALALAACPTFGQMVRQALRGTSGALAGIWSKDAAATPHRCHCRSILLDRAAERWGVLALNGRRRIIRGSRIRKFGNIREEERRLIRSPTLSTSAKDRKNKRVREML